MIHSITLAVILALKLVTLHGADGREVDINPHEVSSMRPATPGTEGHFPPGTACLITMTNGKVHPIKEDCGTVRSLVESAKD